MLELYDRLPTTADILKKLKTVCLNDKAVTTIYYKCGNKQLNDEYNSIQELFTILVPRYEKVVKKIN